MAKKKIGKKAKKKAKKSADGPLSPRHEQFCQEYMIDLSASAAYSRVYKCRDAVANTAGPRLFGNVRVQARIKELLAERAKDTSATAAQLCLVLTRIAMADPRRLFGADGEMLPVSKWGDETALTVASVESLDEYVGSGENRKLKGYVRKVKMWDKVSATVALLKHRVAEAEAVAEAAKAALGSKDNPLHHRIAFIEFADVVEDEEAEEAEGAEAVPGAGAPP